MPKPLPRQAVPHLRSIAANVRRRRQQLGLTQEALAEAANLDLRFVQRVEYAEMNISIGTLAALAQALKTHPAALLRQATPAPVRRGRPQRKSR